MSNYADRFNEQYLLSLGHVVATIVGAIGDDQPEVAEAMRIMLGDLESTAHDFPRGHPLAEVQALKRYSGL